MSIVNIKYHTTLASYFAAQPLFFDGELQKKPHVRKCMEQPWQQIKAELWDDVTETLCNLDFIQAKACSKQTYDLVKDYHFTLDGLPEYQPEKEKERKRQEQLDKYTQDLIACAKGEIPIEELEIPESIPPWTQEQIYVEIERIKTNPTRADKLRDFINFLGQEANNLQNYAFRLQQFAIQQAWNYADSGPVGETAGKYNSNNFNKLLLRNNHYRIPWNPTPLILKIFKVHTENVFSVKLTTDGKYAISASKDRSLILWDLESGNVLKRINLNNKNENNFFQLEMDSTPDGRYVVFTLSNSVMIWETDTGQINYLLNEHDNWLEKVLTADGDKYPNGLNQTYGSYLTRISITPDCGKIIFGDDRGKLFLLNRKSGKILCLSETNISYTRYLKIMTNGRIAISVSDLVIKKDNVIKVHNASEIPSILKESQNEYPKNKLIIWDLDSFQPISKLENHGIVSMQSSEKKAFIYSNFENLTIKELDINTGLVKVISSFKNKIKRIDHFIPVKIKDNYLFLHSGDKSSSILYKDLNTFQTIKNLSGHSSLISDADITPDGKRLITSSVDKTLILWDLEKGHSTKRRIVCADWKKKYYMDLFNKEIKSDKKGESYVFNGAIEYEISIEGHQEAVKTVCGSIDGKIALSGSADNKIIIWDLKNKKFVNVFNKHTSDVNKIIITRDNKFAVSCSIDGYILLWNLDNLSLIQVIQIGNVQDLTSLAFSPDYRFVVSGSDHLSSKKGMLMLIDLKDEEFHSPALWDLTSGKLIKANLRIDAKDVTFTPDGKRIISANSSAIALWDAYTDQQIKVLNWSIESLNVICITPDGRNLYVGSSNALSLMDLDKFEIVKTYKIQNDSVTSIVITPDGNQIIYGTENGTVILMNLGNDSILATFISLNKINALHFFSDRIIVGDNAGDVFTLSISDDLLVNGEGIITITAYWDFELNRFTEPLVYCPLCGQRFEPSQTIIQTIIQILQDAKLKPNQSPCIAHQNEAWNNSGLIGSCPKCLKDLKFNPFFGSDANEIIDYYFSKERELQYQKKFDEAENAFKEENWEDAYNLYLKLVQQGKFDANYMRYNMALCRLNSLTSFNQKLINDIDILVVLLKDKGANDKAKIISEKLGERLDTIKQEELARKKALPWWKKIF